MGDSRLDASPFPAPLRNTSGQQESHLTVQLLGSGTPVASVAQLELNASQPYSPATATLPGAVWQTSGQLAPGASADWSIRVPASALGLTTFGVYPLAAQAQSVVRCAALATTTTYLPYEPARKGAYASSRPVSGEDLLALAPGRQASAQRALAGQLHRAAGQRAGAVKPGLVRPDAGSAGRWVASRRRAVRPSLADSITWVVDPALLANVQALAACHSRSHGGRRPHQPG